MRRYQATGRSRHAQRTRSESATLKDTTVRTAPANRLGPRPVMRGRPAAKRIIVGYGFWIFLLSDIIMFSAFFATYAVLNGCHRRRAVRPPAFRY